MWTELRRRLRPDRAAVPSPSREPPPFLHGTSAFILHYVRGRALQFVALLVMVSTAAACAVTVQYAMKLLVDALTGPREGSSAAWTALSLFIVLIAVESLLLRLSGWFGCHTTVGIGVDVRLDLFDYLNGQPMRYFANNLAGSLGQRITSTAGNFGALANTTVWRVLPPVVDFLGALVVFATVDWHMTAVIRFGERGRPRHRDYAAQANAVGGELIDVISNMWTVKAFSARSRESGRLSELFHCEARAQRKSWMYTPFTSGSENPEVR